MALRSVQNKSVAGKERARAPSGKMPLNAAQKATDQHLGAQLGAELPMRCLRSCDAGRTSRAVSRAALPPRQDVSDVPTAAKSALPAALAALALTASALNPGAVQAISNLGDAKVAAKEAVSAVKQAAPSSGKFNFLTTSPPQVNDIQLENQNLRSGSNGYIQATREGSGSGAGASSGPLSGVNFTRDSFAGPSSGLPSSDEVLGGASGALQDLKSAASDASSSIKGAAQDAGINLQGAANSAKASVKGASDGGLPGSSVDTSASTKPVSYSITKGFNTAFEVADVDVKAAASEATSSIKDVVKEVAKKAEKNARATQSSANGIAQGGLSGVNTTTAVEGLPGSNVNTAAATKPVSFTTTAANPAFELASTEKGSLGAIFTQSPAQVKDVDLANQSLRTGNQDIQATREGSGSGAGASSGPLSGVNFTRDSFAGPSSGLPSSDEVLGGASGALQDLKSAASDASSSLKGAAQDAGINLQGAANSAKASVKGASDGGLPGSSVDTSASTKPVSYSINKGFNAAFEVAVNPIQELKEAVVGVAGDIKSSAESTGRSVQNFADESGNNLKATTDAAQSETAKLRDASRRESTLAPEVRGISTNASADTKNAFEEAKNAIKGVASNVTGSVQSAGEDLKDSGLPGSSVNSAATKPVSFRQGAGFNPTAQVAEVSAALEAATANSNFKPIGAAALPENSIQGVTPDVRVELKEAAADLSNKVKGIMSDIGSDAQAAQAGVKGAASGLNSLGEDLKGGSLPGSKVNTSAATKPVSFTTAAANPAFELAGVDVMSNPSAPPTDMRDNQPGAQGAAAAKRTVNDIADTIKEGAPGLKQGLLEQPKRVLDDASGKLPRQTDNPSLLGRIAQGRKNVKAGEVVQPDAVLPASSTLEALTGSTSPLDVVKAVVGDADLASN
ncbi:hypothetical protein QJQ45_006216 [Haematococcus lacustris]|nr:hypothetical protein QJQ45_006216 [Haematococcus lacustris]